MVVVSAIRNYVELSKPSSVALLVFTSFGAMVVAAFKYDITVPLFTWVLAMVAITLGCAGANAATCYIDRDIDAMMERTMRRPLPSKRITPPARALYYGLSLIGASLALGWLLGLLPFLCLLLGVFDNVVVYSVLLKRTNPLNIIIGGLSGGFPALFGWTSASNSINLLAILVSGIVVLWIPNHIWNLAIFYSDDYEKAKVPMLPVVVGTKSAMRCVVGTVASLVALMFLLWYIPSGFGLVFLAMTVPIGLVLLIGNLDLLLRPTARKAWLMFKLSSPYLAIVFIAMILDVVI